MKKNYQPLVSCILPTRNRRRFLPNAIRYFVRQDYANKELVIIDDGTDCVADLIPAGNEQIRYIRLSENMTLGEKRNYCIRQSRGDLIMHWDDDDWMAPYRISYQVGELLSSRARVCGLRKMFFCELETEKCWLYQYPADQRAWLAGGSLLYTRDFWENNPFPDMQVASDTKFIWDGTPEYYLPLASHDFYVAAIHPQNTSPKQTSNYYWQPVSTHEVKDIVGADWPFFISPDPEAPEHSFSSPPRKTKIAILITTFGRPEMLQTVLHDLDKEASDYEMAYFIADDNVLRNGKPFYWKTINGLWNQVRDRYFDYYIQLPDDVQLEEGFVGRAIQAWETIEDPEKICLNLLLDGHRLGQPCWTRFWPQLRNFEGGRFLKTQWMDLFYICNRRFFEQLHWKVDPVPSDRWRANPHLSSGVGQQISQNLDRQGWHLYQVTERLAEHAGDLSLMNPQIRPSQPLRASSLPLVYAGMASIPSRENLLQPAVASIAPYVDRLFLFLNAYTERPGWLAQYSNVTAYLSEEEQTDMGDAGKFYGLNNIRDGNYYYFTCDDDMVYPPDYVWKMIRKIEHYRRAAIVGCGGYTMKPEVNQFYRDRRQNWHVSMPNAEDRTVHILHTCLTAWHSSAIAFRYEDCEKANMGDLWLALAAQKQRVPMILIERPPNWVAVQPVASSETIYGRYRDNCEENTEIYNSWNEWTLFPAEVPAPIQV